MSVEEKIKMPQVVNNEFKIKFGGDLNTVDVRTFISSV